jgi:hypothetical protein
MESPAGCDLPTKLQDGTERWWKHVESFVKDNLSLHHRSLQIVSCHLNLIFSKETGMATKKNPWPLVIPGHYQLGNVEKRLSFRETMRSIEASKHLDVRRPCCAVHAPMIRSSVTAFSTRGRKNRPGPGGPRVRYHWIFSSGNSCNSFKDFRPMLIYVDIRYLYIYRYLDIFWILLVHSASAIPHNPPNTINTCVGEAELLWSRRLVSTSLSRCYG